MSSICIHVQCCLHTLNVTVANMSLLSIDGPWIWNGIAVGGSGLKMFYAECTHNKVIMSMCLIGVSAVI